MSIIVARMVIVFGPPDSPDPQAFMAEIDKLASAGILSFESLYARS